MSAQTAGVDIVPGIRVSTVPVVGRLFFPLKPQHNPFKKKDAQDDRPHAGEARSLREARSTCVASDLGRLHTQCVGALLEKCRVKS